MTQPGPMKFGIFLAPFHHLGDNPTLALERDLELLQHLDRLGYDEAWIGEHHSAGWETIASPEIFIATAAERTRHLRLGTGVISLPYHHPFMVAERMVLLDHLTRGRAMLGVGPGALQSDAYMLGIDPLTQRPRMDEALGVILRLFTETEPLTLKSDWFELREARLQLRPYTRPHMLVAVASTESPAGMRTAGTYGVDVISISTFLPGGLARTREQWAIAEQYAARSGKTVRREGWRLMLPIYIAESKEEALNDVRRGAAAWNREYFGKTLGRQLRFEGPDEQIIDVMAGHGAAIVGTPEDAVAAIRTMQELSGGFGGLMGLAHEWAPREKIVRSYELFARYVMPHFQGSLVGLELANRWARDQSAAMEAGRQAAVAAARAAHEQATTTGGGAA
jgi:limonene 1,2-monooxygenase